MTRGRKKGNHIDDETADGLLAPEFDPFELFGSQLPPQKLFGFGGVTP